MVLQSLRDDDNGRKLTDIEKSELLAAEIDTKFRTLDSETGERLTRYSTYTDYYNGSQKGYRTADPGRFNKQWNLCAPTVDTFTSLVFGEMVQVTSIPDWETNIIQDVMSYTQEDQPVEYRVEWNRSEFITKLLKKTFNPKAHTQLLRAEHNASKLGTGVLQWGWNKEMKRPFFASIYPGFVRFAWKSQDFSELEYVFISVPVTVSEFRARYGIDPDESMISYSETVPEIEHEMFNNLNRVPKILVSHYYDDKVHIIRAGSKIIPIEGELADVHNYGVVPITLFTNRETDDRPLGESDLIDGVEVQKDINHTLSAWFDVTNADEGTKIIVPGGNQATMEALKKKGNVVIGSNREGPQPYILTREGRHPDIQARLGFLKDAFFQTVGLSQAFTAAPDTSVITQVGINAVNFPTLVRLKPRMAQRMSEMHRLVKNVLKMYEKHGGTIKGTNLTFKKMIDSHYDVDIRFKSQLPRDEAVQVQSELFKLDRRIQSRAQTMTNLGIENSQEELDQIAYEEHNPLYSPDRANEERRMEMAESAQAKNSRPEQEVVQEAQAENQALQQGQPVPVEQESPRDNQIHMTVHQPLYQQLQEMSQNVQDPAQAQQVNAVLQAIEQHLNEHKTRMASLQGGGSGGGQGAFGGRPEQQGAFNPPSAQAVQPPS